MNINFNQANAAYQAIAKLQEMAQEKAPLAASPNLPGEDPTRFKPNFNELLAQALDNSRDAGYQGEGISAQSIANKAEYHQLVTAVNNADLTLRTVVAVRDRMINAYQDIIKMPI